MQNKQIKEWATESVPSLLEIKMGCRDVGLLDDMYKSDSEEVVTVLVDNTTVGME